MEPITWMGLLVAAPSATGLAALHLMGKNNRAKVGHDLKKATNKVANKVVTATAVAQENRAEGKSSSIVEDLDGKLSRVDVSKEVVDLREKIEQAEAAREAAAKNVNRIEGDGPYWGPWPKEF